MKAHTMSALNHYYAGENGASYSDEQVDRCLARWFWGLDCLKDGACVLDLACGDGVWSLGLLRGQPGIQVVGVDISSSAISSATRRLKAEIPNANDSFFFTADLERPLDRNVPSFDLIYARGLFLFNQHDFGRPGAQALLNDWHRLLNRDGVFLSMYGSREDRLGTYTRYGDTRQLPTNAEPQMSAAVDFRGGKFNHSPATFLRPFTALESGQVVSYSYRMGRHTLLSSVALRSRLEQDPCGF